MLWWLVGGSSQIDFLVALEQPGAVDLLLQEAKVLSPLLGEVGRGQLVGPGLADLAAALLDRLQLLGQVQLVLVFQGSVELVGWRRKREMDNKCIN